MDTGQSILVVEDEKKISDIVRAYLEKEGYRVIPCRDRQGRTEISEGKS